MDSTTLSTAEQSSVLVDNEIALLSQCESIVTKGIRSFVEVGNALKTIRDQHLYRGSHKTFEQFVKEKWDFGRAHAYRLIDAAVTVETLSPIGDILPTNESHVRPLLQFAPEDRPRVWETVVKRLPMADGKPVISAKEIESTIDLQVQFSTENDPFKKRRLEVKRQTRDRSRKWREKHNRNRGEAAVPPAPWNLEEHLDDCAADVRRDIERWPVEHRPALAVLLRQLAGEVELIPTTTCPNCGRHEVDDDGDCVNCLEPAVVADLRADA